MGNKLKSQCLEWAINYQDSNHGGINLQDIPVAADILYLFATDQICAERAKEQLEKHVKFQR